jgi:hypothetical protein
MLPFPIVSATLNDSSKAALSFYSEAGKPVDVKRARRLIRILYGQDMTDGTVIHPSFGEKPIAELETVEKVKKVKCCPHCGGGL